MKTKNNYIETLPLGIIKLNLEAIREDGINLTDEEEDLLCNLEFLTKVKVTLYLPDRTELELNSVTLAVLEFRCSYYVAPEWMKPQIGLVYRDLAKNIFSKFYPDVMKKFPTLLDSVPPLKYRGIPYYSNN